MTKISEYLEEHREEFKPWLEGGEQGRIEIKVLPYLKDIENGIFVEAGALDGLFMSNTKILEDLGWDGLLVEPQAKAITKCLENRKCSFKYHAALVAPDFSEPVAMGDFFFDGFEGEGAWSSVTRKAYTGKIYRTVPAATLKAILEEIKITKVDFFSLDVEGYEMEVLKGTDFDRVDFRNVLVESNPEYPFEELESFMTSKGFNKGINLSNFNEENSPDRKSTHQDYLFTK